MVFNSRQLVFLTILMFQLLLNSISFGDQKEFKPRFKARGSLTLLDLTGYQQTTDYTCGPSTILTVLSYYGFSGDEMKIAAEVRTTSCSGTHPLEMTNWLKRNGFDAEWGSAGSSVEGVAMIRRNLERGIPTIIEWIDWGGHWVSVAGFDTRGTNTPEDDVIILADPYDRVDGSPDGLLYFNAERFKSMWFDSQCFEKPMKQIFINAFPKGVVSRFNQNK
ncbi:MAG: C39 family peptidase [Candidatus Ozemobacteraceae bacterium]